jgi:uncharacterized protein (TIGR03435 family)
MKRHEQAEAVLNRFLAECADAAPSQGEIEPIVDRVWERLQGRVDELVDVRMSAGPSPSLRSAWAAAIVLVAALVMVSVLVWRQGSPFPVAVKNGRADEHSLSKSSTEQAGETSQLTVPQDVFELASVKLLSPSSDLVKTANQRQPFQLAMTGCADGYDYVGTVRLDPGRLTIPAVTVYSLVMTAYGQDCTLVEGGPSWVRSGGDYYEIQALLPPGTPSYTQQDLMKGKAPRLQRMLQNLLADRFRLVLKHELREMSVYALTVATRGKMKLSPEEIRPVPDSFPSFPGMPTPPLRRGQLLHLITLSGEVQMSGHALSMSDLTRELRADAGRIIVDKTGLNEVFDVDLKFTRDTAPAMPLPGPIPAAPPQPTPTLPGQPPIPPVPGARLPGARLPGAPLRIALEDQLGLKLESVKMPIEILIIESVQKPPEN